ncbi:MAG: hypothetical protein SV910_03695 [Chloroflexota bacterium]|nr:hypothetical protein [Chloroflexota bacterium]
MNEPLEVVITTPIYRGGAYVLDLFLANQKAVQRYYPSSELMFATAEGDLAPELEALIASWGLRGRVLLYETVKPAYARSRGWNVACGREALRRYVLEHTDAGYMLCLDADMTYDPHVVDIMMRELQGHDYVHSGYALRDYGLGLSGTGCTLFTRGLLERMRFRCVEFRNGDALPEDVMVELDLFRLRARVKKGFFVSISHYVSPDDVRHIDPRPVGVLRAIANSPLVRYILILASITLERNIPWRLKRAVHTCRHPVKGSAGAGRAPMMRGQKQGDA